MGNLICSLRGVRGRNIKIYDTKCEITTDVTIGSVITSNATDGTKTLFYKDCTGIQYKDSKFAIGYLQLETPSGQMNNEKSNFFGENTFTFEDGKNNVTNELMREVYQYIVDRMEGYKYGDAALLEADLPPRLARLYGKPRPPLKRHLDKEREARIQKEEQEEELAKKREEEEQARKQAEALEHRAKLAEQMQSIGVDERIVKFLDAIDGAERYLTIQKEWNAQGLCGDAYYNEIEKDIEKRAYVERMYGSGRSKDEIRKFIVKLQEKLYAPK